MVIMCFDLWSQKYKSNTANNMWKHTVIENDDNHFGYCYHSPGEIILDTLRRYNPEDFFMH